MLLPFLLLLLFLFDADADADADYLLNCGRTGLNTNRFQIVPNMSTSMLMFLFFYILQNAGKCTSLFSSLFHTST